MFYNEPLYRAGSEENLTDGLGEFDKEKGEGEAEVEDVVRMEELPQFSLGFLRELESFPEFRNAE